MAINTTAIANLLRPGLAAVFGNYRPYPTQWSEVFSKYESDKSQEIEVEMKMLGLAQLKQEGAGTAYDNMGQRFITSYVHRYVSVGFIITRQAIKDNLYKTRFPLQAEALRKSMDQTKEILGAAVLNNGFDSNFPIGDGQPLYSTQHPIDGNIVANTFTVQTDLNETSLEDAIIGINQFQDVAGLKIMAKPRKVVVPPQQQFILQRILGSSFRTSTANNDINAMYAMDAFPEGGKVNQFLTNPNAWYVMTDAENGFKYYEREKLEYDMYPDFDNDNLKVKALERYSFGVSNFRASFASQGM